MRGVLQNMLCDNGAEFIDKAIAYWSDQLVVAKDLIALSAGMA